MKPKLTLLLLFMPLFLLAQLNENFSDGDFTSNPSWTGNTADWVVASGQLQSNNLVANSTFYLSTANTLATTVQWEFYVRLNFNTSSANYVDVYLTASASDLTLNSTSGYFVRIGNTQDDICLYRKDANGASTKIIDGVDGTTNFSDNTLKVKVIRNASNQFTLYRDASGTGNSYSSEGSITDATYTTSGFFGILVKQSTSSFFQRHFFDDIVIQPYVPDLTPPSIQSISVLSPNSLDVLFSEPVDIATSQIPANYIANNSIGSPTTALRDATNNALVHLSFSTSFPNGTVNLLTVNGVQDFSGNAINNGVANFSFYTPQQYDVIIDEIMADPTPQVALPNAEFIELKNVSGKAINLSGWRITTSSSSSGSFPAYTLPADSFLILTSTSNAANFSQYGKVIGVASFPSLTNEGTLLTLTSKEGKTIHAVEYSDAWYNNAVKKDGGWTLEMIDTKNPCNGANNWKASTDASGGTPGRKNSVDGINTDNTQPRLIRTYSIDSITVVAVFDEPLDSIAASVNSNYTLDNNTIISVTPQSPLFNKVLIKLSTALQKETVYTLTVTNVKDCKGNSIGAYNKGKAGLAEEALKADIVINEILFNPRPNAYDYVELYNKTGKVVDGNKIYMANRSSGNIGSIKKLSETPYYIYPGEYIVVTEDVASLRTNYLVQSPENVLTLSSLPSYPDDKGDVVITNSNGDVIDELAYEDDWHFALISDDEGVALERLDPDATTQNKTNWHSAAATAGYGTPTYKNSQYKQAGNISATIDISPKTFSPDNDGNNDVASISYQLSEPGYVANVTVFDANGRTVRYLVKNDLLGLKGSWNWDGLGDKAQKLPIGVYIVYTEIFNLDGKKKSFKDTVVLARKMN